MGWIHTVLRVLVGAAFVFFGLTYFLPSLMPDAPPNRHWARASLRSPPAR